MTLMELGLRPQSDAACAIAARTFEILLVNSSLMLTALSPMLKTGL
jgi:hypothetical protein